MNDYVPTVQRLVISGGASGIGLATATIAHERGAEVVVLDLPQALEAAEFRSLLEKGKCLGVACDVRDSDQVNRAYAEAVDAVGVPDGVVCSAGIEVSRPSEDLDDDTWNRVIETNLGGTYRLCRAANRVFLQAESPGSVVCLSSPFAEVAAPSGGAAYSSSKGGVAALVRTLAVEYAARGIRVNAVAPGPTETPLMWAATPEASVGEMRRRVSTEVPMGRLADPADPARLIIWLLSREADFVTGAHIPCDGGVLAKASISL